MDERRLADVRCDGRGRRKAGSGYLVAPQLVLTACHVLIDEAGEVWPRITVRVGHPPSGRVDRREAAVCWTGPDGLDVALLRLDAPVNVPGTVRWGRPEGRGSLPYTGLGYPLQTRAADGHRRVEHLRGVLSPLAGGAGRHDLNTLDQDAAPRLRPDQRQGWGGVSGAAVFCQGHLVGVVVQADEEHENRRLHALPVRRFAADPAFVELLECHGGVAPDLEPVRGQPSVPRSGYLLEVRELAAGRFEGRAEELAAMAGFCTDPLEPPNGAGAYWRWLAEPWSGKTALMAQFAMHPPPGVDVLAFFVIQRHGGNSDRTAFLSAMERQLREYLRDHELECRTQGQFLDGLGRAAKQAEEIGHCLVLLVDGLDEDTGVASAVSGHHSIAALLPRDVPPGLRILVAGRPNPPAPVSANHPLRSHAIDHWLERSPVAQVVRDEAVLSLDALLTGGGLGEKLVTFMAAASSGLSAADLAELTGTSARKVEIELGGTVGRVFQRRAAQWPTPDLDDELFSFAHQELLSSALELLAPAVLNAARDRIHAFVARHRDAGWPLRTPEYALLGYSQMLRAQRDAAQLVELATDSRRHACLWQRSGGHQAALDEIALAFDLLLASDEQGVAVRADGPDLAAALRLAFCRTALHHRVSTVPRRLLEVWARLGSVDRAVTLTRSYLYPTNRAGALADLARALVLDGHEGAAYPVLVEAEKAVGEIPGEPFDALRSDIVERFARIGDDNRAMALTQTIIDPDQRLWARRRVMQAWARAGRYQEAIDLAGTITDPKYQADSLTEVAVVLASADRHREAAATARLIGIPEIRVDALASVAGSLAKTGRQSDALDLLADLNGPDEQVPVLASMIQGSIEAGRPQQAAVLAQRLADAADTTCDLEQADTARTHACRGLARANEYALATKLARRISLPNTKASVLAEIAGCLAGVGEDRFAARLATEAAEAARHVGDSGRRLRVLGETAAAAARTGQDGLAAELAKEAALACREKTDRLESSDVSSAVQYLIDAGQYKQAAEIANAAGGELGIDMVRAWAKAGQERLAVDLALTLPHGFAGIISSSRDHALAAIVGIFASAGKFERALAVVDLIADLEQRAEAQGSIAVIAAKAGEHQRATDLALAITDQEQQANALTGIADTWAACREFERALAVVDLIADLEQRAEAQGSIAVIAAKAGEHQRATDLALAITDQEQRAITLTEIAYILLQSGELQLATTSVDAAAALLGIGTPFGLGSEAVDLAAALAEAGMSDLAVRVARLAPDPGDRMATEVIRALVRDRHETQALLLVHDSVACKPDFIEFFDTTFRVRFASWMAEDGRHTEAGEMAMQVIDQAHALTDARDRDVLLAEIAEVLTCAHKDEKAIELILSIADRQEQEHAVARVTCLLVQAGKHQKAVDLAHSTYLEARIFAYLARTSAERGQLSEAAEFSTRALDEVDRAITTDDNALGQVVQALSHMELRQEAAALVREITDVGHRLEVTAKVADILALQGQYEQAVHLAEQITDQVSTVVDSHARERVLTALAQVWVRTDRCQKAVSIATTMPEPSAQRDMQMTVIGFLTAAAKYGEAIDLASSLGVEDKSAALRDIARALAQAGRHVQAVALARTITKPEEHAEALAVVATHDGLPESRRRLLLTEALATAAPAPLIKAVGRAAPHVLSKAAQHVLGDLG
ncbi:trypsin-like peptidase domain-containing protein [Streptomyces mirabilis]|nr:trypsin-like peptidase domain-containing protein [Streptomyces mirabilis]